MATTARWRTGSGLTDGGEAVDPVKCTEQVDWIMTDVQLHRVGAGSVGKQVKGGFAANTNHLQGVAAAPCISGAYVTRARFDHQVVGQHVGFTAYVDSPEQPISC